MSIDVFGCSERRGRPFRVNQCVADFCSTTAFRVNRCYAVFASHLENRDSDNEDYLVRVNLCTRRAKRVIAPSATPPLGISAPIVAGNGDMAWIWRVLRRDASNALRPTYQVVEAVGGKQTVLDESPQIDPSSLALAGRRLYWTSGGVAATAVLG